MGRSGRINLCCFGLTLILSNASCFAETLGRLFFSPEQRQHKINLPAQPEPATEAPKLAPQPMIWPAITVNGIIQQHNSPRHVWLNGQHHLLLADEPADQVGIQIQQQEIRLSVGQSLSAHIEKQNDNNQTNPSAAQP